jgi:hypothetical protein
VRQALAAMAAGYSTAAVSMGHLALKRTIRHAEANNLISRNVATLTDRHPKGQQGRPSKSLTLDQAIAVITAARTLPSASSGVDQNGPFDPLLQPLACVMWNRR